MVALTRRLANTGIFSAFTFFVKKAFETMKAFFKKKYTYFLIFPTLEVFNFQKNLKIEAEKTFSRNKTVLQQICNLKRVWKIHF